MSVSAMSSPLSTQTLPYMDNYIQFVYGQDCGTYSIALEPVDPTCDMSHLLTVAAPSGTGGSNNQPYPQEMTLESNDINDVGECDMEIVVTSDGFLDKDGVTTRTYQEKRFPFKATVKPCVATLANVEALEGMTYTLADPS